MKPAFEELAQRLRGFVRVGAVNCEKEQGLCAMEGVDSYPTLKMKKAGVSTTYDGADTRRSDARVGARSPSRALRDFEKVVAVTKVHVVGLRERQAVRRVFERQAGHAGVVQGGGVRV